MYTQTRRCKRLDKDRASLQRTYKAINLLAGIFTRTLQFPEVIDAPRASIIVYVWVLMFKSGLVTTLTKRESINDSS
jgi:hypothetical protein